MRTVTGTDFDRGQTQTVSEQNGSLDRVLLDRSSFYNDLVKRCIDLLFSIMALPVVVLFGISLLLVNPFANPYMLPAVIGGLFMQLAAVYIPFLQKLFYTVSLSTYDWSIIAILAVVKVIAIELTKEYFIVRHNNKATNTPGSM